MSMFALTNARGETVDINNDKLLSYTPTGLGVQFTNTYSQYETYFKATKSTVTQGQFQIYILFGDVESQAYQTFSDFAQFLAYQPLTLTYTTDSGTWYRDGRLNSLTKTEIGGSTVFATDRINESFTLEFINNWYNNKSAEYKSYDPDPNLGTYGKIYGNPFNPLYRNRNFVLNSSGLNASATNRPAMQANGVGSAVSNATVTYNSDSMTLTYTGTGTQEWYYALAEAYKSYASGNLDKTKQYTISVDVKGTVPNVAFRMNNVFSPSVSINNSTWTTLTYTFTFPDLTSPNSDNYYIRLNASATTSGFTKGQTLSFRNFKLEEGNKATYWTPAPEDSPSVEYTYVYAPYYVYIEANRNTNEQSVPLVNKSQYFGLQKGSPCIITIGGSPTDTLSPSWSVIQNGSIVATDGVLVALSKNQKLVVSSYPEDQYARVYNPDGSYADVSQLQDFTKTNFVQIPEGESTVLFYVDNQATVNLTFKEERLLV